MEETIEKVLDKFYNHNLPQITDVTVLSASLELGIICIRWREEEQVITVKAIVDKDNMILTKLT